MVKVLFKRPCYVRLCLIKVEGVSNLIPDILLSGITVYSHILLVFLSNEESTLISLLINTHASQSIIVKIRVTMMLFPLSFLVGSGESIAYLNSNTCTTRIYVLKFR